MLEVKNQVVDNNLTVV